MKYYLIPLVDTDIYYHCQSLRDILREKFPLLARREEQRIDILYSTRFYEPIPKQELNAHNHETMLIYQKENIPMYLIAYGTDELSAHEIFSREVLLAKYPAALGIREVTKDSAEKYFKENDYFNSYISVGIGIEKDNSSRIFKNLQEIFLLLHFNFCPSSFSAN